MDQTNRFNFSTPLRYWYNNTYNETNAFYHPDFVRELQELYTMDDDRAMFRYVYHAFAACIVILNVLLVVSIVVSQKQRRFFRNWLILHITVIHILYGGVVCPFLGEGLVKLMADLDIVSCKLLSFLDDILDYMSNVTIGVLGVYQCLNAMSPRFLKGVSRALLAAMMIVVPWFVCVMLTAVLRITMSEEHLGTCYLISDRTAQTLWLVLAYGFPLFLILLCFVTIIYVTCSPAITTTETSPNGRRSVMLFVSVCLACCLLMRTPFYFVYSDSFHERCNANHGKVLCLRLTHSFDLIRLASLIVIPSVYLIPTEIKRGCRKIRSKLLCKTVDCSTNSKQSLRMMTIPSSEKTAV